MVHLLIVEVDELLATSGGKIFDLSVTQRQRLAAQEKHKKCGQPARRVARRYRAGGQGQTEVARYQRYAKDVRRDLTHQTSHVLASDERYKLYVFEALKIQNMTRRPKAKQVENGRWAKNGAKSNSGLAKSILGSAWSQTKIYPGYKSRRAGKLCIEVPAFWSSQELTEGIIHAVHS